MTTAKDLIQDALERLGVYAPGETISDADAERGLNVLNDMMDSWSNESLTCYAIKEQSGTLVVGKNSYTVGTGGDFAVDRPLKILDGPGTAYILDTNSFKYPVQVVQRDTWNRIASSANTSVTSNIPDTMFYDPQYPLGIINLFPTPNITYTLYWDSYAPFSDFSSLTAVMSLPPGYKLAIESNLALEISPYFKPDTWSPPPLLLRTARLSKANVKRTNSRLNVAVFDPEIVARSSYIYNIYNDSTTAR